MKFVVLLFAVLAVNIKQIYSLQVDTMDTFKTKLKLTDTSSSFSSGILKSHFAFRYSANMNKTLWLSAPPGYSIFVGIRLLDLRPNNLDSLTLYENGSTKVFRYSNRWNYRNRIYDSSETLNTFYAKTGQMNVTFFTGPYSTDGYDGFELIYTVQDPRPYCTNYKCNNGKCISSWFTCDGHNHCGDRSDQKNCAFPTYNNGSRIGGIVAGVVFLLIAVMCAIFIIVRRTTRSRTEIRTIHCPPTSQPGYVPGPYPEPGTCYPPPPPPYSQYNQGVTNPGFH